MDWLRWHHGTAENGRWRMIARRAGHPVHAVLAVWVLMCERASDSTVRGTMDEWDDEAAAAALDLDPEAVLSIRNAMDGKVLEGMRLLPWDAEQVKREREDNSAERVRAFREKKRQETDVTPRNAKKRPDKIREEEIREEKEDKKAPPTGEQSPAPARMAAPPPPSADATASLDRSDKLVAWWVRHQEGSPPDSAKKKQGAVAALICAERSAEDIRRAISGMGKMFPYSNGQPWDLMDLRKVFDKALQAERSPPTTNGNGKKHDAESWRVRREGDGRGTEDDPAFNFPIPDF